MPPANLSAVATPLLRHRNRMPRHSPRRNYLGDGPAFTQRPFCRHELLYFVQSVNAYGQSPFLRVEVVTTNNFDEEFAYLRKRYL